MWCAAGGAAEELEAGGCDGGGTTRGTAAEGASGGPSWRGRFLLELPGADCKGTVVMGEIALLFPPVAEVIAALRETGMPDCSCEEVAACNPGTGPFPADAGGSGWPIISKISRSATRMFSNVPTIVHNRFPSISSRSTFTFVAETRCMCCKPEPLFPTTIPTLSAGRNITIVRSWSAKPWWASSCDRKSTKCPWAATLFAGSPTTTIMRLALPSLGVIHTLQPEDAFTCLILPPAFPKSMPA
mmetsp:Transcript_23401/g.54440  ORF Transcript_23401/g.54440 Transcript_23401/m.54440 type:complete len:243 (-) Transcript_23401:1954-2682(-)